MGKVGKCIQMRKLEKVKSKRLTMKKSKKIISKKADVTQVFIFTLSALLVGLILYFGYTSFFTIKEQADQIDYIRLKADLEKEIISMKSEYKSFKKEEFIVPARFQKVCFAQHDMSALCEQNQNAVKNLVESTLKPDKISSAIITDAVCTTQKNVFFVPDGTSSLTIENMRVADGSIQSASEGKDQFFCAKVTAGKIVLKLTGMGKATCVTDPTNPDAVCI